MYEIDYRPFHRARNRILDWRTIGMANNLIWNLEEDPWDLVWREKGKWVEAQVGRDMNE